MNPLFEKIQGKKCHWQLWVRAKCFTYDLYIGERFIFSTDRTQEAFIIEDKSGAIFDKKLRPVIEGWGRAGVSGGKAAADAYILSNGGLNVKTRPKTKPELDMKLIQLAYL